MALAPDIQTGRNVYVDADLYASDEAYAAEIEKYVAEGFYPIEGTPEDALAALGNQEDQQ